MASGSGNISNVMTIGGFSTSPAAVTIPEANSQGYFALYTTANGTANGHFPLYKNGTVYQVPVGKTFKVVQVCVAADVASQALQLVSATASFSRGTAAGSLTGGVFQSGVVSIYTLWTSTTAYSPIIYNCLYDFAAQTYPGVQAETTTVYHVMLWGKEV